MSVNIATNYAPRFLSVPDPGELDQTRFQLKIKPNGDRILVPMTIQKAENEEATKKYILTLLASGCKPVGRDPSRSRYARNFRERGKHYSADTVKVDKGSFEDLVRYQQESRKNRGMSN